MLSLKIHWLKYVAHWYRKEQALVNANKQLIEIFEQKIKNRKDFNYEDTRFTTKGKTLYSFFMGWPSASQVVIKPLAINSEQKTGLIENVELLGYGKVSFTRDTEGLKVTLPSQKPCEHAFALKIDGTDLV